MSHHDLTIKTQRLMEERWDLQRNAIKLLDMVVAEWSSDPTSVQCFDLRMVNEAKETMARLKVLDKEVPF